MTVTSRKYFSDWFVANGINKDWGFDFTILSQDDVIVQVRDGTDNTTIVNHTTDLGFYPAEDFGSGTVRYPIVAAALPVGKQIRILRQVAYFQLERIGKEGKFLPQTHEKAFDRVTILTQQVDDNLERAVKVQIGGTAPELTTGIPDGAVLMKQGAFIIEGPSAASINSAQGYAESAKSARDEANFAKTAAEAARDAATATLADSVRFGISQNKTLAEKGQARANIGAGVLAGFRNKIINGDFAIAQRGSTVAVGANASAYTLDRWRVATVAGITCSASRTTAVVGSVGGKYYATFAFSGTGVADSNVGQRIEDVRTLAGKRVTLTFRHGATVAQDVLVLIRQNFGTGGSPSAQVLAAGQTITFPSGLSGRSSLIFDLPSIAGKTLGTNGDDYLEVLFVLLNANANTIYLADVSLVEGDATAEDDPFSPRHPQQELALCQRYYEQGFYSVNGFAPVQSQATTTIFFKQNKRVAPTTAVNLSIQAVNMNSPVVDTITVNAIRVTTTISANASAYGQGNWTAEAEI